MKLTEILSANCVVVPLQAGDKAAAIKQLVHVLVETGHCSDEERLLSAIFEREAIRSTGIGKGLAVPHGKCDSCPRLVMSLGKPATPIDFDSADGAPVDFIALLASPPDQTGPHIQALARISRLMLENSFRTQLEQAQSSQEVYDIISRAEL